MAEQAFTKSPSNILERNITITTVGDPTKALILAPTTTTTHKSSGEQSAHAHAQQTAQQVSAIQALYESNNGPITASSLNDDQISYLLYSIDGATTSQRSSSQSTSESS